MVLAMFLVQGPWAFAAESTPAPQGCRKINVRCQCTNPTRDFVVKNQKLGRANLGEPGECKTKLDVDASAAKMPIAYCLKGESVKDERLGESKCTATWTCVEPCTLK